MVLFEHYKAENQKLVQPGGYVANPIIIKNSKTPEPNEVAAAATTENLPSINEANEAGEGDIDIFNID